MKTARMRWPLYALLATTAIGANAAAYAQTTGPIWDSSELPESRGTVKQYTLTPRGDVDGIILTDGTEVKLPPHLTAQTVFSIHPGDQVSIRGLRARAVALVDAASITNVATGRSVVDSGPPDRRDRGQDQMINGRIAAPLHGKRGEVNGALLEDGTVLRLPPPEAERLQDWLRQGQPVSVRGGILDTPLGRVVDVQAIGNSPEQMSELAGPRPPRGPADGPDRRGPPPPPPLPGSGLPPPPPPRS
ncbi:MULTISPECIES: hypothetical protein [unclassified Bradyrhizobium]|uniref:hypothetical protein n=1 Tax=unclassified Bradyrhizobium TaxID=2631580 RepID=UPI002479366B|nr:MULTISPECIES: hypothetical protein [unclassified Bradyrhizobium]WGR74524.1 hypothetical protein MTX24_17555 [Bradyrhizobium sp. ISRA426]WGR79359.1 hypothetical protein MTX21_02670 [Bradyrhizobium sp. ISRA430]WGR89696.1 hypothetical protein MTX25_17235 [Bradyrhizobium sp. ISRA432]